MYVSRCFKMEKHTTRSGAQICFKSQSLQVYCCAKCLPLCSQPFSVDSKGINDICQLSPPRVFVESRNLARIERHGTPEKLARYLTVPYCFFFGCEKANKKTLLPGCNRLVEKKDMSLSEIIRQKKSDHILFAGFHFGMEQFVEKDATVFLVPGLGFLNTLGPFTGVSSVVLGSGSS